MLVEDIPLDIKVAVMGCVVNGPGEAKEADIGIAGGIGRRSADQKGRGRPQGAGGQNFCPCSGRSFSTGIMRSEGKNGKTFF